jgi:hypothetical protein
MKRLLGVMLCLGLVGCATPAIYHSPSFSISVDGLNDGENTDNKKIFIAPPAGVKDVESDLQFVEFSNYIKKGLAQNGAVIVDKADDADILITLRYGISDPKEHTFNYSVPIIGQNGVASSTTNISGQSFGNGNFFSGGYSGTTNSGYTATTTYTPSYGVIGSSSQQETIISFARYFVLEAYDLITYRTTKKVVQLWKISVSSVGGSGDLRRIFPVMVAGSAPYFGKDTGHKIDLEIGADEESIGTIKDPIKYIVTQAQIEAVSLNWNDISGKLTQNGWADVVNPTEVRLKVNFSMEKDKMSKIFGDSFPKVWSILERSKHLSY